ncbi:MAG: segregation/condensation protein A [Saprospiraceae bacterium]|nr:segregation/condensation protein A [Saprospiraceae bacterium]
MDGTYTIKLPQFEGPFDLLLFFIERDELDIHDIPVHQITDEFLSYIRLMESMNIDLASEFILVAATLCRIKAKMLIPRQPVDEEGNEIDPRDELVRRLLEYKRYKSILDEMRQLEEERAGQVLRGNATKELKEIAEKALVDAELESITLFKLLRAFESVMARYEDANSPKRIHTILQYPFDIAGQQSYIYSCLEPGKQSKFEEIFEGLENRIHAIITFLALLELLNMHTVKLVQGIGANNFWLELRGAQDEEE